MKYLQRIWVIIGKWEAEERRQFVRLAEKLAEEGITLEFAAGNVLLETLEMPCGNERYQMPYPAPGMDSAVLYICDDPPVSQALVKQSLPVLAYFNEQNKHLDFPGVRYAMEDPAGLDATYFERIYRRLQGIPWEILQTERCVIRETIEEDVDAFYEIYSDPRITKYTEGLYPSKEEERQYIREYIEKIYAFYEFGVWTVLEKDTQRVIGRAGFSFRAGFENPELGFVISVPWQGKGIAGEICLALLGYGKEELGFDKVNVFVRPENEASLRLCRRLGFLECECVSIEGTDHLRMEWSSWGCVLQDFD